MSLTAQIDTDIKDAMRAKDTLKLGTLRMLKSAFLAEATKPGAAGREVSDADAVAVIRKQIKSRQDSADQFTANNRPELAEKELAEIKVLETYLPAGLTPEQLKAEVAQAIVDSGLSGGSAMGAVMKLLKERVGDRVDGKSLSAEVKAQLG